MSIKRNWLVKARRILREWRAHIIVWTVQWIGGSAMMSAIGKALWQEFHRAPLDWYFIGAVFVVGLILVLIGLWFQHQHVISTDEKWREIEARIPSITVNGLPVANSEKVNALPPPRLVIHSAVYGTGKFDDVSVLEKLNTDPKDGLVIPVDNTLVPNRPDPAPGVRKRLHVEYSYDNSPRTTVERREAAPGEPSRLLLPEDSEVERLERKITQLKEQSTAQPLTATIVTRIELAGVLRSKAGQSEWLAKEVERVWHIYNNEGEKLIRPLGERELPDSIELYRHKRLWGFRILYRGHIDAVKFHAPDFHSGIVDAPSPCRNIEYLDLLEKLKEHAELLRGLAQSLEPASIRQPS